MDTPIPSKRHKTTATAAALPHDLLVTIVLYSSVFCDPNWWLEDMSRVHSRTQAHTRLAEMALVSRHMHRAVYGAINVFVRVVFDELAAGVAVDGHTTNDDVEASPHQHGDNKKAAFGALPERIMRAHWRRHFAPFYHYPRVKTCDAFVHGILNTLCLLARSVILLPYVTDTATIEPRDIGYTLATPIGVIAVYHTFVDVLIPTSNSMRRSSSFESISQLSGVSTNALMLRRKTQTILDTIIEAAPKHPPDVLRLDIAHISMIGNLGTTAARLGRERDIVIIAACLNHYGSHLVLARYLRTHWLLHGARPVPLVEAALLAYGVMRREPPFPPPADYALSRYCDTVRAAIKHARPSLLRRLLNTTYRGIEDYRNSRGTRAIRVRSTRTRHAESVAIVCARFKDTPEVWGVDGTALIQLLIGATFSPEPSCIAEFVLSGVASAPITPTAAALELDTPEKCSELVGGVFMGGAGSARVVHALLRDTRVAQVYKLSPRDMKCIILSRDVELFVHAWSLGSRHMRTSHAALVRLIRCAAIYCASAILGHLIEAYESMPYTASHQQQQLNIVLGQARLDLHHIIGRGSQRPSDAPYDAAPDFMGPICNGGTTMFTLDKIRYSQRAVDKTLALIGDILFDAQTMPVEEVVYSTKGAVPPTHGYLVNRPTPGRRNPGFPWLDYCDRVRHPRSIDLTAEKEEEEEKEKEKEKEKET